MQHLTNCAGSDAIEALEARAEKLALDSNSSQGSGILFSPDFNEQKKLTRGMWSEES